jgi:hypothetical protein
MWRSRIVFSKPGKSRSRAPGVKRSPSCIILSCNTLVRITDKGRWVQVPNLDQYCQAHGLEEPRVVDASVMTDVIRASTNAMTIMIAERVADWIR